MRKGVSVGLECGEVFGAPEAVEQSLPVFEVDAIILDPRVEGAFQAVFAQVLAGQHPEGLVEGIAIDGPQRTQLRDGVDVALVLIEHPHELLLADAQTAKHEQPFVPVLADVAENGLGEVLDHVLGLSLLAALAVLVLLGVAVLGLLGRTADFAAKVHFFERFGVGGGIVGLLDDFDAVVGLDWGSGAVGTGTELF